MKKNRQVSLKRKLGLFVGMSILLSAMILITYAVSQTRKEAIVAAENQAVSIANKYSKNIQLKLELALDGSRAMADALSIVGDDNMKGEVSRKEAVAMAEKVLFSDNSFLGFTLAFEPNVFDGKDNRFENTTAHDATGRFVSYVTKAEDGTGAVDVLVDYETAEKGPWYWNPKLKMKEVITEPVVYPVQGVDVTMISCMTPIINDNEFLGVTGIDYSVDFMQELVSKGDYYDGNYQLTIVSNQGMYVANKTNSERNNTSLKEYFSDEFEERLKLINAGEILIETTSEYLEVHVPLIAGKTDQPWQVTFSVPNKFIVERANTLMWNQIIMGFLLTILGISFVYIMISRMIKPIEGMVKMANAMAEGDLKSNVEVNAANDEIGQLYAAFSTMKVKIVTIINEIQTGANQISGASEQMSSTSMQLSNSATEQASSIEEVSSTMEEIAANVVGNTSNAQQTSAIADESSKGILKVSDATQKSLVSAQDIAEKISIINDIAFQTNILALNAAVEAARAGELGRGFAVVAGEVRKLAELSKKAADDIIVYAKSSVEVTENAGELMVGIMPGIEKTATLLQEISASSIEQSNGVDQINNAIQQLNNVTQQNASVSEELASSAGELSTQAIKLTDVIAFFKV